MLSTPADSPFFSDFTVASTSSRRIGPLSLLIGGETSSALGPPVVVCVYNSELYSVQLFRMSCSSVRHFLLCLFSSPLFRACQFFYSLEGFLAVDFLQVFFFYAFALFFNPCLLCFSHAFFFKLAGWLPYKVLHLQSYFSFVSALSVCRTALVCCP